MLNRRHSRRALPFRLIMVVVAALALLATACGGDDTADEAEDAPASPADDEPADDEAADDEAADDDSTDIPDVIPIRFGTAGIVQTPAQSSYTSLPEILGFWEDVGLDLERLDFEGASAAAQALDAEQVDIAMFSTPPLFNLAERDENSTVTAVCTNITTPFSIPVVPADSDIETAADFEGRTIGVASLEHSQVPVVRAMLGDAGGDPDSITFVPTGQGAEAFTALDAGRIDVLALWDSAHADVQNLGVELRDIPSDFLSPERVGFAAALNVRRADLDDPVMREGFVRVCRAHAMALAFADENPEAAVQAHWEVYPESKPTGIDDEAALAQAVTVLNSRMANMQPIDGRWGWSTPAQIEGAMELQILSGQLTELLDIDDVYTDELIDEINDFDEEAVREMARNWTP